MNLKKVSLEIIYKLRNYIVTKIIFCQSFQCHPISFLISLEYKWFFFLQTYISEFFSAFEKIQYKCKTHTIHTPGDGAILGVLDVKRLETT